MSIHTFNESHIGKIQNKSLRATIRTLWLWKAKNGVKIVQRVINSLGGKLVVDGWFGGKSRKALSLIDKKEVSHALTAAIDGLEESRDPLHITIAKGELGVKEIKGRKHNKRVLEYHATTMGKYTTDEVPWCGSFVNWVMLQAGYTKTVAIPERAEVWSRFGMESSAVLGAIAVKARRGGGHVCFVVGKSANNKYSYCLGGNQSDAVTIKRYKKSVFTAFRSPHDFEPQKLTVFRGSAKNAGNEA